LPVIYQEYGIAMKKILVTLGPSSFNERVIKEISIQGVYLFRINLSHTEIEKVENCINFIRQNTDIPICLDSEGAQIRNQKVKNGKIFFEKNSIVKIFFETIIGDSKNISFTPEGIAKQFIVGDIINIDFDLVAIQIVEKNKTCCIAKVLKSGYVCSNRAVDINRKIKLPAITEKDKKAFKIGKEMGIKNFALSFANSEGDVKKMRAIVGDKSSIICKIESEEGLINLKSILNATDEVLIDRGDLSRQIPIEKIPFLQRRIISMARIFGRPVYVATNLLESMLENRTPTRAEVNDIVSTILMGADGLVLAAETAIGKYPVAAVEVIKKNIAMCKKWSPNTNILEILEI
jgi:pyruvate kinase